MRKTILIGTTTLLIAASMLLASCGGGSVTTTSFSSVAPLTHTTTTAAQTTSAKPATTTAVQPTTTAAQPTTTAAPATTKPTTAVVTTANTVAVTTTAAAPTTAPRTTTAATTSAAPASSAPAASSILGQAGSIKELKYDMTITGGSPSTTMTSTFWMKNNHIKTQSVAGGMTSVTIMDTTAHTAITYIVEQKIGYSMTYKQPSSAADSSGSALSYNPVYVGTDTIDGKAAIVYTYTYTASGATAATTVKAWYWKDKGLPLKMESTTSGVLTTITYSNYSFTVADSEFVVPAGITMMTIPGMPGT
jgi:outer membrane lipoprotein-sorting protein